VGGCGMSDDIMTRPLFWKKMQVSLTSFENEQSKKIVEDELVRQIPVGSKHFSTRWVTYLGEDYVDFYVTFYEVSK
jgi:hypothetical protein